MKLFFKHIIILSGLVFSGMSIKAQNSAPVTNTDTVETWTASPKYIINFKANDYDPEGNNFALDSIIHVNPTKGVATISGLIINYTPDSSFLYGKDTLYYRVCDDGSPSLCSWGMILINVKYKQWPAVDFIDVNNIRARVYATGELFHDKYNGMAGFEYPKGSGKHLMYASNIWVAGKSDDTVRTAGYSFYPQTTIGPSTDSVFIDRQHKIKWNKIWQVSEQDVNDVKNNWMSPSYTPPPAITEWPAHGDPQKGQSHFLAPYYDNQEGVFYEPHEGDHPRIGGDESWYLMFNTKNSPFYSAELETHARMYGFNCATSPALNNAIFINYKIVNKSNKTLDSAYVGLWSDPDLGLSSDDYIGCNVDESYYYCYNGVYYDPGGNGVNGYGQYPPTIGMAIIKGAKMDEDGTDNTFGIGQSESVNGFGFSDGIVDNERWGMEHFMYYNLGAGVQGDPQSQTDYYNYLMGRWRDGSPMTYGGSGHNTGIPCKYMFPGNSDSHYYGTGGVPQPVWSEQTANNTSGDRRGVSSTGPFTLDPGESMEIEVAYVVAQDTTDTTHASDIALLEHYVQTIKNMYYQNTTPCGGRFAPVEETTQNEGEINVYPNPHHDQFTVEHNQNLHNARLNLKNMLGQIVLSKPFNGKKLTVNTKGLKSGVYIVNIESHNNSINKKIIKK